MLTLYPTAAEWDALLRGGRHALAVLLQPGDAAVRDNRRILHRREPYEDAAAGGGEAAPHRDSCRAPTIG